MSSSSPGPRRSWALGGWLGLAAGTPLVARALWHGLTSSPSSGCFGLGEGASIGTFATVVLRVAAELEPGGLVCVAPALVLPLAGLGLLSARRRPLLGWTLSVGGFLVHALTAVALASIGC